MNEYENKQYENDPLAEYLNLEYEDTRKKEEARFKNEHEDFFEQLRKFRGYWMERSS